MFERFSFILQSTIIHQHHVYDCDKIIIFIPKLVFTQQQLCAPLEFFWGV